MDQFASQLAKRAGLACHGWREIAPPPALRRQASSSGLDARLHRLQSAFIA
jgi:hypothetical protein